MDSHKNHKAFVQIAKRIESGHNECCSALIHWYIDNSILYEYIKIVEIFGQKVGVRSKDKTYGSDCI